MYITKWTPIMSLISFECTLNWMWAIPDPLAFQRATLNSLLVAGYEATQLMFEYSNSI